MSGAVPRTLQIEGPAGHLSVMLLQGPAAGAADSGTVVMLHPVNLDGRCWLPVAERMRGLRCVLIDSRGHGRSHMNGPFGIHDYAADVVAVIEALDLRVVHLVGASLGGSIACAVAGRVPAASLFALGSSLEPADRDTLAALGEWRATGETAALFDEFLEQEMADGLSPMAAAEARRQVGLDVRGSEVIKTLTFEAFMEDARRLARDVHCPAMVLTGEHDRSCPPDSGARMAAALGAPFEILPGLGHLAMMQAPDLIAGRLLRFIHGVSTS